MLDLFVGFRVNDSNDKAVSIRQRSHIKSLFVGMLQHIWNLTITNCKGFEYFIIDINLNVVSSSNVFNILVFVFGCNVLMI